jgi:hypothetical protein
MGYSSYGLRYERGTNYSSSSTHQVMHACGMRGNTQHLSDPIPLRGSAGDRSPSGAVSTEPGESDVVLESAGCSNDCMTLEVHLLPDTIQLCICATK